MVYFRLQLKRTIRALPVVVATALILLGCIFLLFMMVDNINKKSGKSETLRIGLTGDTDDEYFSMGLTAMQHLDSSRYAVELVSLTKEEAIEELKAGRLAGYAVIPEGFVESVMYGENKQITLVTTNGSEDLMGMLVLEFMEEISEYLVETQNAIYGMQGYLKANGMDEKVRSATDDINIYYVNLVLGRDNLFKPIQTINSTGNLSQNAGYIIGLSVFLIMMFGITCSPLYTKSDVSLNGVLSVRGIKVPVQVITEYLTYLIIMLLCVLPLMSIIVYAIDRSDLVIKEWNMGFFEDYVYFIAAYIPVIAMFAAMQYMLFLISDNFIGGVLLQFIIAIFVGYLGGCLYPIEFFPEIIRKSVIFQPAGLAYGYLADALLVRDSVGHLMGIIGYCIAFLVCAGLILKRRLKYEM